MLLQRTGRLLAASLLTVAGFGSLAAGEAELLSDGSGGIIALAGESRILVRNLQGNLTLRVGKPGELRYMCRSLDNRREERSVELWLRDKTFVLEAPEALRDTAAILELAVPPELDVEVEIHDSRVLAQGLYGALTLRGTNVQFDGRALVGSVEVELEGGKATIIGAEQGVTLEGRDLEVRLVELGGPLYLSLASSSALVEEALDTAELDLDQCSFRASVIQGRVAASTRGGKLELDQIRRGAELRLNGTPLVLSASRGFVLVETDAEVEFQEHQGKLQVDSYGAAVRGSGITGPLTIQTDNTEVHVEKLGGPTTIQGDGLDVVVREVKGNLTIDVISSKVEVDQAQGPVDVKNEFGDVVIRNVTTPVQVNSRNGNVAVTEATGPLQIKADGPEVLVRWALLAREKDSLIENPGGDIRMLFPSQAACRVEARAPYGRIESRVPGVQVADDAKSASGVLRRMPRPTVQIVAGGDLYLSLTAQATGSP